MAQAATTTAQPTAPPRPGTWTIDPAHTSIEAVARHLMVSRVRGRFESFSGTVDVAEDPTESTAAVTIDAASINTNEDKRDAHLRSPDFLDADNHPQITFRSTAVEHIEGNRYRVTGELTIRGETREIAIDVDYFGVAVDPWGNDRAFLRGTTTLNREDWNMTWNQALEAGGVMVGKQLDVELDVQLVRADE